MADKPEQEPACNPASQKHQHPLAVDLIKVRRAIRILYPVHLLALQNDGQPIQRIVRLGRGRNTFEKPGKSSS